MSAAPGVAAELTVIIVSYNTKELTLAAVRTLLETTRSTAMEVIVYDNDSQDGSADAVATEFPGVTVVASQDNLGFAKANNVVAETATTPWLLLLNPDTECHDGAVDTLMAFAKANPEAGIYGGRTVFRDGSLNAGSCFMKITPWSLFCWATGLSVAFKTNETFNSEVMGGWARDSIRQVDIVVGCFFLIPTALWKELGGFDLRYFMYGEEADLCHRAAKLGYRPMITPDAEIMHIFGAASKTRADKMILVAKARMTLIRDHWPTWQVPLGEALMWVGHGARSLALNVLAKLSAARFAPKAEAQNTFWAARKEWLAGY